MIVGYIRTAVYEQTAETENQKTELQNAGCEKLFHEQVSSFEQRSQLAATLEYVREGDILIVTKLARLACSIADFMTTIQTLEHKKVCLRVLNLGMDTDTPEGRNMLSIMGEIARFEREIALERQRNGIARGKAKGRYKGRTPISADRKEEVLRLAASGLTRMAIAKKLDLGVATVYRILAMERAKLIRSE